MSFLSQRKESSGHLNQLLRKNPPLKEVFESPDFDIDFRNADYELMAYLLSEEHSKEFVDNLITGDRTYHERISKIFQSTNNTQFHRLLASNKHFTDYAFRTLDPAIEDGKINEQLTDRKLYAAGTLSRLLSRAIGNSKDDIAELFLADRGDGPIFKKICLHLEKSLVYQQISDLVSQDHKEAILMMWYMFRMLAEDYEIPNSKLPMEVFMVSTAKGTMTLEQKGRAVDLLVMFFQAARAERESSDEGEQPARLSEFEIVVMKWVEDLSDEFVQSLPTVYNIAAAIGANSAIANRAISHVKTHGDNIHLVTCALGYLAESARVLQNKQVRDMVAAVITPPVKYPVFALQNLVKLIRNAADELKDSDEEEDIKRLLVTAWNASPGDINMRAHLMECMSILGDQTLHPDIGNWQEVQASLENKEAKKTYPLFDESETIDFEKSLTQLPERSPRKQERQAEHSNDSYSSDSYGSD